MVRLRRNRTKGFSLLEFVLIICAIGLIVAAGIYVYRKHESKPTLPSVATKPSSPPSFNFGFDFSNQEPDPPSQDSQDAGNVASAVSSAKQVLSKFAGSFMDQSIYGFGAQNPEPSQGDYNLTSIEARVKLITDSRGIPVITMVGDPHWMHSPGCDPDVTNGFFTPPCPSHYQDFANMAAHIAQSLPQVKYFVVWNEFKGFHEKNGNGLDYINYTSMYNDVFTAIKKVRPDAIIGGPYVSFIAYPCSQLGSKSSQALQGSWGCIGQNTLNAFTYWLNHKVGADFIAIDGGVVTERDIKAGISPPNPLTASEKFAAVDQWVKSQSNLPLWWMESPIQPKSGWSNQEGAAARIATLILMNSSGASAGLYWQPQEQAGISDEGLWTSTEVAGGGQPTILASELEAVLPFIRQPLKLVNGQPSGVLVATEGSNSILVNTTSASVAATLNGHEIGLSAYQVLVK